MFLFQNTMSNIDKTVHSEENIINDAAPVPAVANPVAECEMDALLLGRIGVSKIYFSMD